MANVLPQETTGSQGVDPMDSLYFDENPRAPDLSSEKKPGPHADSDLKFSQRSRKGTNLMRANFL